MKHHFLALLAVLALTSTHATACGDVNDIPELKPAPAEIFADNYADC